jgi:hypothetical protein
VLCCKTGTLSCRLPYNQSKAMLPKLPAREEKSTFGALFVNLVLEYEVNIKD